MRRAASVALACALAACAPGAPATGDSGVVDSPVTTLPAPVGPVVRVDSTSLDSARVVPPASRRPRVRDSIPDVRGRDSVIIPDFGDPTKRLPSVPDTAP